MLDSSSNVSELNNQLKDCQQLIGELPSADGGLNSMNEESIVNITELSRQTEYFKSTFTVTLTHSPVTF